MSGRFIMAAYLIAVSMIITSCAGYGTSVDRGRLEQNLKVPSSFADSGLGADYGSRWWEVFDSGELNSLMDKMLRKNLRISMSYEGLRAMQAALGIISADRLPTVQAGAEAGEVYSTDSKGKREWRESYELSLTASYEADIWGRIKAGVDSGRFELQSGRHDLESLYMSLTAELADRYFLYKSLAVTLKLQKEQLDLRQKQIDALKMMYSSGVGLLDTVYSKRSAIADLLSDISQTLQAMDDAKRQIAFLTGEPNPADIKITDRYDMNIPSLPAVIPADVVRKRPDIRSAYALVMKTDRDVAQAVANRYPKLTFTAALSYSGSDINKLVTPDNFVASVLGGLVMPLFDAGKRKQQVIQQKHLLEKQIYDYQNTVLTALKEVGSALGDNVQKQRALALGMEKVGIEEKRLSIAEMKYRMGIKDYSDVMDNKISLLSVWMAEESARRLLVSARIELARASGGSWTGVIDSRLAGAKGEK